MNNIELENQLVEKLNIIKQEFIKDKDLLKVSIRKDVVAVELKSILEKSTTYKELCDNLETYIKQLYSI